MKILSNIKFKNMEAELELYKTAKELLTQNLEELVNELEKKDTDIENRKREMFKLLDINRELGDDVELLKKENKRLKTLLTKNKISYKKEK